jgi:hypothetical protein
LGGYKGGVNRFDMKSEDLDFYVSFTSTVIVFAFMNLLSCSRNKSIVKSR